MLSKYFYYISSIPRLLLGIANPLKTIGIFLGWHAFPTEILLRYSGLRFKVRSAMDVWVIKETVLDRDYFPRWARPQPDWQVVDIGGGLGDFTVLAAERCWEGVVHVYEPLCSSFALLQENIALNEIDNVVAHQMAVAAEEGMLTLDDRSEEAAAVSTRFVRNAGSNQVRAVSLQAVLAALPNGFCHFLKADCEGGEFDIFLNSDPILLQSIERISLEYHDGFTEFGGHDLAHHFKQHGFRVWQQKNPVHDYLGLLYAERD